MLSNGPPTGLAGTFGARGPGQAPAERHRGHELQAGHGQWDEQIPREATRLIHQSEPEEEPREGEPQSHARGDVEGVQDLLAPGGRDELDPEPPGQRPEPEQGKGGPHYQLGNPHLTRRLMQGRGGRAGGQQESTQDHSDAPLDSASSSTTRSSETCGKEDRKSTRLNSSHITISY